MIACRGTRYGECQDMGMGRFWLSSLGTIVIIGARWGGFKNSEFWGHDPVGVGLTP